MDLAWRERLRRLPDWASNAVARCGRPFDYIAYRLAEGADEFNAGARPELERLLLGTRDLNSHYSLDADQQRQMFLVEAIRFADYFRPMSAAVTKSIPKELRPKGRPFASGDIKCQIRLRKQIEESARALSSLLRQHDDVTQRLGVGRLDCDPLELMLHARNAHGKNVYLEGVEKEFDHLLMRRGFESQPARALSFLMDRLHVLAKDADRSLLPAEVRLGMSSRKRDLHFLDAFEGWLSENQEESGGFIPNGFRLSDSCWAVILSCLTYKEVQPKSIQMYRSRAPEHLEKALRGAPRFDIDELIESWSKGIS